MAYYIKYVQDIRNRAKATFPVSGILHFNMREVIDNQGENT